MDHRGGGTVLRNELPVGLAMAGGMKIGSPAPARAVALGARGRATGRAGDGQNGVVVCGEVGHDDSPPCCKLCLRGGLTRPGFSPAQKQSGTQASIRAFFSASMPQTRW